MRDDASWFAHWEEELPPPDELMPISQSLITPDLAAAFDISTTTTATGSPPLPLPIPAGSAAPLCQVSDDLDSSAGAGDETARTLKRPRLVWTPQLHKRFVDAVSHLGIKNAVPKTIMQLMNVDGLTRENVASHLQKYRLYLKRMKGLSIGGDVGPPSACDHLFASTPIPAAHHHFENHSILQFLPGVHHPSATNQFFGAPMPPPPTGGFSPEFDHRYLARHQSVHRVAPTAPMMMGRTREFGSRVDEFKPRSPTPGKLKSEQLKAFSLLVSNSLPVATVCLTPCQQGGQTVVLVLSMELMGSNSSLSRKVRPKLTFSTFMLIFVLGALGPVIDQNFYYAGLKFTSPTFSCAMSNILPALTFVMAVLCRMENIHLMKVRSQAKIAGTLLTVAGAMLMTLYKGSIVELPWAKHAHSTAAAENTPAAKASDGDWFKGSIFLIIACLAWAAFFIVQAVAMKRCTAQLSLTTLICFMGTLQSIAVTLVMEHEPSVWKIGFDMNLMAAAYAGIVASGVAYYVQGLVMEKKGPVFATAFSPLMMIIVAIMGSFILHEVIYLGGIIGGVVIIVGLYSVLWGKYKDSKAAKAAAANTPAALRVPAKDGKDICQIEMNDVDLEKANAGNLSAYGSPMVFSMPTTPSKPLMLAIANAK